MEVTARDLFCTPLSPDELDALLHLRPAHELFSWRSPAARALRLPADTAPAELRRLMLAEPRLIRRPLLRVGDLLLVGFDRTVWQRALESSA